MTPVQLMNVVAVLADVGEREAGVAHPGMEAGAGSPGPSRWTAVPSTTRLGSAVRHACSRARSIR